MAEKTVGALIKEARTAAGLTQEQLAKKVGTVTASDIGKAERGEAELSQAVLKQIAKVTGVTQASLLNAAKSAKKPEAKKTESKKTEAKKTEAKKTEKKETEFKLTAAEKKLVELYRAADKETKEDAVKVLKGDAKVSESLLSSLFESAKDLLK